MKRVLYPNNLSLVTDDISKDLTELIFDPDFRMNKEKSMLHQYLLMMSKAKKSLPLELRPELELLIGKLPYKKPVNKVKRDDHILNFKKFGDINKVCGAIDEDGVPCWDKVWSNTEFCKLHFTVNRKIYEKFGNVGRYSIPIGNDRVRLNAMPKKPKSEDVKIQNNTVLQARSNFLDLFKTEKSMIMEIWSYLEENQSMKFKLKKLKNYFKKSL